jgi:hypothetical protein
MADRGNLGRVLQKPGGRNTHNCFYYHVEEWVKRGRTWICSHNTWWRKQKCRDVKIHRTKDQIVSTSELRKEQQASQEEYDNVTEITGTMQHTKDVGLCTYYAA